MILSLSGGKDSTALALYCKDKVEKLVFCDTGLELPETYKYINELVKYINKPLVVLKNKSFKFWLKQYKNFLPSPKARWCTRQLKIIPFEHFLHTNKDPETEELPIIGVGLRADEEKRKGYLGIYQANYAYPFIDDGIEKKDVDKILSDHNFRIPSFYKWKTRSGCYACPFFSYADWINLYKNEPKLFEWAKSKEKTKKIKDKKTGEIREVNFYWNSNGVSLKQFEKIAKNRMSQQKLPIEDIQFNVGCNICYI